MTNFKDLYNPLWCYTKGVSEAFTELLNSLQTNYGIKVSFETLKEDDSKYFHGLYDFESKSLKLVPTSFTYFYGIHELFHFLVSSKEEKKLENWGMPFKSNASLSTDSHLLNEIKTVFAAAAYTNKYILSRPIVNGMYHISSLSYSPILLSINSFGIYREYNCIAPNVLELKTSEDVAMALKDSWYRLNKIQKVPENFSIPEYSEPSWKDWLRIANLQEVATKELIRDNFFDENCILKPMDEWNLKL